MGPKRRYEIDLTRHLPDGGTVGSSRPVGPQDVDAIAELMLDAYRGTIDHDGESLPEAVEEVVRWFGDAPDLDHSLVVEVDGRPGSAVLVSSHEGGPLIAYVMTRRELKRSGLARSVTVSALRGLAEAGHRTAVLYITQGNLPSEALFSALGAQLAD